MKIISKSALQANLLDYFQAVETTGEDLVIISDDRPVLKIVPYRQALTVDKAFADVFGKIRYHGDLPLVSIYAAIRAFYPKTIWRYTVSTIGYKMNDSMAQRIIFNPEICHGKPCIRALRYPVETILEWLSAAA